jgi:hypothetical protein
VEDLEIGIFSAFVGDLETETFSESTGDGEAEDGVELRLVGCCLPVGVGDEGVGFVGGVGDAGEFAAVEPDEEAVAAGIDDDVAGTGVEVGVHAAMALGALQSALEVALIGRSLHGGGLVASGAESINERGQHIHGHEQAVALRAIENRSFGDGGLDERKAADRTGEAERWVSLAAENLHAVFLLPRKEDGVAVVALVAFSVRLKRDRSPAGGAIHCG